MKRWISQALADSPEAALIMGSVQALNAALDRLRLIGRQGAGACQFQLLQGGICPALGLIEEKVNFSQVAKRLAQFTGLLKRVLNRASG